MTHTDYTKKILNIEDKKTHRRRKRKECEGMLVQTDGTPFDWFNIGQK